jgi:hypothetical protein
MNECIWITRLLNVWCYRHLVQGYLIETEQSLFERVCMSSGRPFETCNYTYTTSQDPNLTKDITSERYLTCGGQNFKICAFTNGHFNSPMGWVLLRDTQFGKYSEYHSFYEAPSLKELLSCDKPSIPFVKKRHTSKARWWLDMILQHLQLSKVATNLLISYP